MYSYHDDDETGHGTRNLTCINFTAETFQTVFAIKMSLSSFAIIANLVVFVLILLTKKAKDFMYRLVLYLMATDILQAIAIIFISLPITVPSRDEEAPAIVKPGWSNACIFSGFFSVTSLWMGNIIIFWIALYLAWLGWCLYRRTQNHEIKSLSHPRCYEALGVVFLLTGPLAIAIIPLFAHGNMYGPAGLWCWIKIMKESCGDLNRIPLIFDLTLFYAPFIVIVLFAATLSVVTVTCCCRGGVRRHDTVVELRKTHMRDIIIVLVIPVAYCGLSSFLMINRIHSAVHESPSKYPFVHLWMIHAIADPIRVLLPALAYLFNPFIWKDVHRMCTHTPADDASQPINSLQDRSSKDYGSCDETAVDGMYKDDDVTDDEYVNSLLKMKTKT